MLSHGQQWWLYLWSAGAVLTVVWFAVTSEPQAGDARAGQQVGGRSPLLGLGLLHAEGGPVLAASAVLTLGAAAIHAAVIGEHFEESGLFGTFFVLATLLQLGWAAGVFIVPSRALVVLGAAGKRQSSSSGSCRGPAGFLLGLSRGRRSLWDSSTSSHRCSRHSLSTCHSRCC